MIGNKANGDGKWSQPKESHALDVISEIEITDKVLVASQSSPLDDHLLSTIIDSADITDV
jgi:hypothetical protein